MVSDQWSRVTGVGVNTYTFFIVGAEVTFWPPVFRGVDKKYYIRWTRVGVFVI